MLFSVKQLIIPTNNIIQISKRYIRQGGNASGPIAAVGWAGSFDERSGDG